VILVTSETAAAANGAAWCRELAPAEAVATDAGRARFAAWLTAGCPPARRGDLVYVGDRSVSALTQRVLGQLPEWAAWHIVAHCILVSLGREAAGFCMAAPPWPSGRPLQIVALCGAWFIDAELEGVIAHEFAHAWLEPVPDVPLSIPERVQAWRSVQQTTTLSTEALADLELESARLSERRAARLARHWGFTGPATDEERCAEAAKPGLGY
jgi:hypothetical protein